MTAHWDVGEAPDVFTVTSDSADLTVTLREYRPGEVRISYSDLFDLFQNRTDEAEPEGGGTLAAPTSTLLAVLESWGFRR